MIQSLYRLFRPDACRFAKAFLPLSLQDSECYEHPFQSIYRNSPTSVTRFLKSFPITAAMEPEALTATETLSRPARLSLRLRPLSAEALAELRSLFPDVDYLEKRIFQKYHMDPYGNMAKRLRIVGTFGQTVLEFNNLGAIGADVGRDDRVNLFVGASDAFEASAQRLDSSYVRTDWIAELEVPYAEAALHINAGVEGAHFPLIVRKAKRMTKEIIAHGGTIENLFVFGGWHNLIYNLNTAQDWEGYGKEFLSLAPRVVFIRISSPLLQLTFDEVSALCAEGFTFWGSIPCTAENYTAIRNKIVEYNSWLEAFCALHPNALAVPLDQLFCCNAESAKSLYRDINHFSFNNDSARLARDETSTFLADRKSFFAPDSSNVSEFIYPLF